MCRSQILRTWLWGTIVIIPNLSLKVMNFKYCNLSLVGIASALDHFGSYFLLHFQLYNIFLEIRSLEVQYSADLHKDIFGSFPNDVPVLFSPQQSCIKVDIFSPLLSEAPIASFPVIHHQMNPINKYIWKSKIGRSLALLNFGIGEDSENTMENQENKQMDH